MPQDTESFQETAEQQSQSLLAAIVDSSDDAIISKNLDGIVTSWNKSAERLFGYAADEAIGRHITLIIPPERHIEEKEILQKLRRGKRIEHFETVRMRKDGTKFDLSLTISPVKDTAGRIIGASKVARDISRRKQAERVLAEQARLLDLSNDAIVIRDAADRITFWNQGASELYGYTRDEAIGQVTHELLATELPEPLPHIRERLLSENRWSGELLHRCKDGRHVVVFSRWALDRDEDGNPRGVLESNNNITQERATAQALQESKWQLQALANDLERKVQARTEELRDLWNRLVQTQENERRSFARGLHDSLGQYLAALSMLLGSAQQELPANQQISEAMDLILACTKEVRTISHLLHPPLLEEGGLASAAAWYIEGFAARSGMHVESKIDIPERLPKDTELVLYRVLQESLTNIHRHSGSKAVTIKIGVDSRQVWVDIKDQGKGMPKGVREGIGIKGMRERVEHLNGELRIDSDDGGTHVRVVLPLVQPPPVSASSTARE